MIAVEMPDLCRIQDVDDNFAFNSLEASGAFGATFSVEIKVTSQVLCLFSSKFLEAV
jgi:hypothetical protein